MRRYSGTIRAVDRNLGDIRLWSLLKDPALPSTGRDVCVGAADDSGVPMEVSVVSFVDLMEYTHLSSSLVPFSSGLSMVRSSRTWALLVVDC